MKYEDFIELASLSVLGALDPRDETLLEECIKNSPELQAELAGLQMAALAIPYAEELSDLPVGLKERVLQRINSEHPVETPLENKVDALIDRLSFQIKAEAVNWLPHPAGVIGVSIAPLNIDQNHRQFSGLVRCDTGAVYPSHYHANDEEILILEGDLIIDGESFTAGDYIYSAPHSLHSAIANLNGCLFFVRTSLDDYFV